MEGGMGGGMGGVSSFDEEMRNRGVSTKRSKTLRKLRKKKMVPVPLFCECADLSFGGSALRKLADALGVCGMEVSTVVAYLEPTRR